MSPIRPRAPGALTLRLAAVAGLAVDAYVHADLSARFDTAGSGVSQGTLFVLETVLAALAAALVLIVGNRPAVAFGLVVALSALITVLVTRYVNVGSLGPLPDMYDPAWYPQKTLSAVAEALAAVACAALLLTRRASARA